MPEASAIAKIGMCVARDWKQNQEHRRFAGKGYLGWVEGTFKLCMWAYVYSTRVVHTYV